MEKELDTCDNCNTEKEELDLDHSLCNDCLDEYLNGKSDYDEEY